MKISDHYEENITPEKWGQNTVNFELKNFFYKRCSVWYAI